MEAKGECVSAVLRAGGVALARNGKNVNAYIAHIRSSDHYIQTVSEHLRAVQEGCEAFGAKLGVPHLAGLAGLLHDLGKNTTEFKNYIQEAVAFPDTPPKRGSVDHSTAGGRFLYRRYYTTATAPLDKLTVEWIANCIISHHQGLRDYLSPELNSPFFERVAMKQEGMEQYQEAESTFSEEWDSDYLDRYFMNAVAEAARVLDLIRTHRLPRIACSLLVKYMFSCLIDADRTNTRHFEENRPEPWMSEHRDFFERCYAKLLTEIQSLETGEESNHPINRLRKDMSRQCDEFAMRPPGIYTLSIPTGGGKTLASLRYALKHALIHGMERIIYIVPYTTIIEQNAAEIRKILQEDDLVLEHHSNVIDDLDDSGGDYDLRKQRLGLARDNWDRPLIFTTMVQFMNTFYAKGTRNVRRLHRLANSVIIFDEVQAIPSKCVSLFNAALNFLSIFGHSTSVLCTATQPALDFVKNNLKLPQQAEIIKDLHEVSQQFKRVDVEDLTQFPMSAKELADFIEVRMQEIDQVLVILNTKSAVRKLFLQLQDSPWARERGVQLFHLSTNMCAAHRKKVLDEMRKALANKLPVICVSTQLIEAGVNISFECVIRSLAGLDSIAQAAGRCNRHGRDSVRKVYVVRSEDEVLTHLPDIRTGAEITRRVLSDFTSTPELFGNDLLSPKAMETYFQYYYHRISGELDYPVPTLDKTLFELLDTNKTLFSAFCHKYGRRPDTLNYVSFATVERHFQVIEDSATSVLVPYNAEAEEILLDLNGELDPGALSDLLRRAQHYVVNLYDHDVRLLDRQGDIYPLLNGQVLALRKPAHSDVFGVNRESDGGWDFQNA